MNASRLLQPALVVVLLLAISAYCVADSNAALWLVAVPGGLAAWWFTKGTPPKAVPRALINCMLLAAVGWAVLRVTGDGFEVEVFSEFVTLIAVVKLLDRRSARDDAQVLTLSAFLSVGAMLTSNSFGVGALLFLLLPTLMFTVILQQIDAAARRAPGDRFEVKRATSGRTSRDIRRIVGVAWATAMVVSIGSFVLMPRSLGTSAFGQWGNASVGSVVGFNDEINLGTGGLISQSAEPVLDVRVLDADERNAGAPLRTFYLRGAVLSVYQGGRWVRGSEVESSGNERSGNITFGAESPIPLETLPGEWTYEMRVTMRQVSRVGTHLFTIWRPERLQMHTPIGKLFHDPEDGSLVVTGQEGKVEYSVWVDDINDPIGVTRRGRGRADGVDTEDVEPVASAELTELTRLLITEAELPVDPAERKPEDNVAVARLLEGYFTRERFVYDLNEPRSPAGVDPIDHFVFTTKTGHCEYYASAMTAMARAVGLPSRVVTGYVATEFNEATGFYLVRASNAHAWVEIQVAPGRWRPFDPTPREDFGRLHEQVDRGFLAAGRRLFETLEFAWIRGVIGFDDAARERLLGGSIPSGREIARGAERLVDRMQAGGPDLVARAVARAAIAFAATFAAGMLVSSGVGHRRAVMGWFRRRFRVIFPVRDDDATEMLQPAHDSLRRVFRKVGAPRPPWRPLLEHARSPQVRSAAGDDLLAVIDRVARAVYRLRFGREPLGEAGREQLGQDIETLRRISRRNPLVVQGGVPREGS
ncbi:MAG: DUF3488 and transglutaminase-like domain-containing protein [Planctomycetota bacterium]